MFRVLAHEKKSGTKKSTNYSQLSKITLDLVASYD